MDIGNVFTQVWSTNPIWSTSMPATQATTSGVSQSGTSQPSGSATSTFASTLQSLTAELQQFEAGTQSGGSGTQTANGTQATGTQPTGTGTTDGAQPGTQATNASDFGDQLGQLAGSLSGDAMLALQLYAGGPAAAFV
jgi:hypothetical protein